jgi:SAM-dependent methyltransferase
MDVGRMREFWDERAREDAYLFVDNRRAYGDQEIRDFWDRGERDLRLLLSALGVEIAPADTVVDIGCGVGRLTRVIAHRAAHVYGVDISREMIERAQTHHSDIATIDWLVGDGTSLRPLDDASVDACVSHVVFQHIPDPRVTLGYVREMGRVLRPGGWAAFMISNDVHAHRYPAGLTARLKLIASRFGIGPRGQDDPVWLGSSVELVELEEVARDAGLDIEKVVGEGKQFCAVLARRRA